jgi:hypothetical protein
MKKLILIFILTLSFHPLAKANDIKDFEIHGMSIGDSLLKFISKDKIENQKKVWYPVKEYFVINFPDFNNNEEYDALTISLKKDDNNYEIKSIGGTVFHQKNIEECYPKKDQIVKDLSSLFKNSTQKKDLGTFKLSADPSGKSNATTVNFYFKNNSLISVQCKDWSEEFKSWDRLKVTLVSKEYFEFTQRAYK